MQTRAQTMSKRCNADATAMLKRCHDDVKALAEQCKRDHKRCENDPKNDTTVGGGAGGAAGFPLTSPPGDPGSAGRWPFRPFLLTFFQVAK